MENYEMIEEILKGNFKVKNPVTDENTEKPEIDDYRKKAIASIGGSMVYVERTELTWDGDDEKVR